MLGLEDRSLRGGLAKRARQSEWLLKHARVAQKSGDGLPLRASRPEHGADQTRTAYLQLTPTKSGVRQIVGLDAIRFLAAALVMSFHLAFWIWASEPDHPGLGGFPLAYEWLAPFVAPGWVGVQVFFVLSGLVIAYSAEGATSRSFFRSRFLRLVPAVWICATISAVTLFLYGGAHFSEGKHLGKLWIRSVVFFPMQDWIDGSYWTLGVEISFYSLVFLVIVFGAWRWIKWVIGFLGLASASFWILSSIAKHIPGEYCAALAGALDKASHDRVVMLSLLPHGCFFALGVFLRFATSEGFGLAKAACMLIFGIGGILQITNSTYAFNRHSGFVVTPIVPACIWLAFVAAIVASTRWNNIFGARRPLVASALRQIGLATYPLYLIHQNVGYVAIDIVHRYVSDPRALMITVTVCVGLAFVVSVHLEPVVRGGIKYALDRIPL